MGFVFRASRCWARRFGALVLLAFAAPLAAQPIVVGVAGSGSTTEGALAGDAGSAQAARLNAPAAAAVDALGRIYICDRLNHRVRRIDAAGRIETFAGSGPSEHGAFAGDGGPAAEARLNGPSGVAVDPQGNVFVADTDNHCVRRVDAVTGIITSVAGSGPATSGSFAGDGGPAASARLFLPRGLAIAPAGDLFICDSGNHRVRRIDAATGIIDTVAGRGLTGASGIDFGGDGGPAGRALFAVPSAVILDARGELIVADTLNNRVRSIDAATGIVRTIAGNGGALRSLVDGPAVETSIGPPRGLAVDGNGVLYIATGAGIVYALDRRTGLLSGMAGRILPDGTLCSGSSGDGDRAIGACLGSVLGLAIDRSGDLLLCDESAHRVRKVLLRAPRVERVAPDTVSTTASVRLTLTGSGLSRVTTVAGMNLLVAGATIGPLPAIEGASGDRLSVLLPPGAAPGLYNLQVSTPEGTNTALVSSRFLRVQRPAQANGAPLPIVLGPLVLPYEVPFRLDGSASLDLDAGDTVSYRWSLSTTVPGVPSFDSTSAAIESVVRRRGRYSFTLSVTDSRGLTASRIVTVVAPDVAPRAVVKSASFRSFILPDDRGRIPASLTTDTVTLDGSATRALDGDPVTYSWSLISRPPASLASDEAILEPDAPMTRFRLGPVRGEDGRLLDAGTYRLRLRVSDPAGNSTSAEMQVLAVSAEDLVPVADPGTDRNVEATLLELVPLRLAADIPDPTGGSSAFVRLDGRRSVDPNLPPLPLSYSWSLLGAPPGSRVTTLSAADSPIPTFSPDRPGIYRAGLVVSNAFFASERREVAIAVDVRGGGLVPSPAVAVSNRFGPLLSGAPGETATCVAGIEPVVLDGRDSTSADPQARPGLSYRWSQRSGPPVTLTPSATAPAVAFVPALPGLYELRLSVTDGLGIPGLPTDVRVRALPPSAPRLLLSLESSASTTSATGDASSSLRVLRPAVVTVRGGVTGFSAADGRALRFVWKQLAGPTVALSVTAAAPTSETSSLTQFAPTTAGVHLLECRVVEVDASEESAGRDDIRRIAVVVETADVTVPRASVRLANKKDAAAAGERLELDGSPSSDSGGRPVLYRWTQTAGPPVVLSDPFSPVTTFVAPDFGDAVTRTYTFALFVENGATRSEPADLSIQVPPAPRVPCQARVSAAAGLTLLALGADPSTGGRPFDAAGLAQRLGASVVIRARQAAGSRNRFEPFLPEAARSPFVIEGNQGYLLVRPAGVRSLDLPGLSWPRGSQTLRLGPGLNLVGYPSGAPAGETAASLCSRTGSAFVARTAASGFQLYLPGVSGDFALEAGRGYLVSVPGVRTVVLPASECR